MVDRRIKKKKLKFENGLLLCWCVPVLSLFVFRQENVCFVLVFQAYRLPVLSLALKVVDEI